MRYVHDSTNFAEKISLSGGWSLIKCEANLAVTVAESRAYYAQRKLRWARSTCRETPDDGIWLTDQILAKTVVFEQLRFGALLALRLPRAEAGRAQKRIRAGLLFLPGALYSEPTLLEGRHHV